MLTIIEYNNNQNKQKSYHWLFLPFSLPFPPNYHLWQSSVKWTRYNFLEDTLRQKCPYSEFFWSKCGKIRARKTPNTNTFHAVTAFRKIEVIWSASRRFFKGFLPQIFLDPILNTLNNYVIRFFTYRSWFLIVSCIFMSFFLGIIRLSS